MQKQMTRQTFGTPSHETTERIINNDTAHDFQAATFRYNARMRELEQQFEDKAGEIRAQFVTEIAERSQ